MYLQTIEASSAYPYDFRKDFDPIARPGMLAYQKASGFDAPGEIHDECWEAGNDYVLRLWRHLTSVQRNYREFGHLDDLELYGIEGWTRESVAAYVDARLVDILADFEPTPPVDVERDVRLAVEMARKQNADGNLPFTIPLDPEAIAFATDHLKSKTERGLVSNGMSTAHTGLLNYRFFKEMNGGNVVYLDRHKPRPRPNLEPEPATKRAAKRLPSALDGVTVGRKADWTDVGGILATMRDYVLATAPYPNSPLATAAALVTLSAVSGGRVYTPTGLNLALYIALLAETGDGKDAPLKSPSKFLHAAGLHYMAQPGKSFTVSGFEQCLIDSRGSCVATCDEIGENLLAKILSKRAMSCEAAIKHFLMELSGLEDVSPPFALTKRAANGIDRKKLHIVHSVPSASFSLFGASTHARFYEALSHGNVDDGSLNRFLIISADAPPDAENIVEERVPVPQSIVDALKAISDAGRLSAFKFDADANIWPSFESERAGWAPGAKELYKLLGDQMRRVGRSDAPFKGLYARIKANALKVATLLALSRAVGEGLELAVTVDDIEMGAAMALESATTTVDGAMKHMAGSEFEENCKTVLRRIDEGDEKGIKATALHRSPGVSKIEPRKFKDVCDFLARTGQVEAQEHPKRKGQFRYFPLAGRTAFEEE